MKRNSSLGQLQGELEPGRTPRLPLESNGQYDLREPWGGLLASAGPRDHIVQLYQDQQFLNRAVCRFAASESRTARVSSSSRRPPTGMLSGPAWKQKAWIQKPRRIADS